MYWHLFKCNLIWLTQEMRWPNEEEIWNPAVKLQTKKLFFIVLYSINNLIFMVTGFFICFQNRFGMEDSWKLKPLHVAFLILFIGILFSGFNIFTFLEFWGSYKRARPSTQLFQWTSSEIITIFIYLVLKIFQQNFIGIILVAGFIPANRLENYFYYVSYFKEINYNVNLIEVFRWVAQAILFVPLVIIITIDSKVEVNKELGRVTISTDFTTNLTDLQVAFLVSYSTVFVVNLCCLVRIFTENEKYNNRYDQDGSRLNSLRDARDLHDNAFDSWEAAEIGYQSS